MNARRVHGINDMVEVAIERHERAPTGALVVAAAAAVLFLIVLVTSPPPDSLR